MTQVISQCSQCKRFTRSVRDAEVCEAFPDGIPREIVENAIDHRRPFPGDRGIIFAPREDAL